MVASGRVQWGKADTYSLVKTNSAEMRVYWAGATLPPSVFIGKRVNFVGRLVTEDGGRRFYVKEAVPFLPDYRRSLEPVMAYLWTLLEDPREWAKPYTLDFLRIKEYKEANL